MDVISDKGEVTMHSQPYPAEGGVNSVLRSDIHTGRELDDLEAHMLTRSKATHICHITGSILFWYTISLSLTAVNKYLFDILNLNFPVTVTFIHFAFVSLLLRIGFAYCMCFPNMPQIDLRGYVTFIIPIGLLTATDIALTNISYTMVSISVITVMKSSICAVTYFLCILFGLETFSYMLTGIVLMIVVSISATVPSMEIHDYWGPALLAVAVLGASLRWVIVHHQLQRSNYRPMELMVLTQPIATVFMAIPTVAIELPRLAGQHAPIDVQKGVAALVLVLVSIIMALFLILIEYQIIRVTSSLAFTVAGVGKEIVTIFMSMIAFHEVIKPRPAFGIALSVAGIIVYAAVRYKQDEGPSEEELFTQTSDDSNLRHKTRHHHKHRHSHNHNEGGDTRGRHHGDDSSQRGQSHTTSDRFAEEVHPDPVGTGMDVTKNDGYRADGVYDDVGDDDGWHEDVDL